MQAVQLSRQPVVGGPVAAPRPVCSQTQPRRYHTSFPPHPCPGRLLARAEPQGTTTTAASSSGRSSPDLTQAAPATSSSSIITDSDISFLFKLLAFSFAGAAVIKYGSLVMSLPFEPNTYVALTLVLGTPAAYSLYLLTKGNQQ